MMVLDVVVREETGTGNARAARRNGMVPGVIYGGDQDAVSVGIKFNEVLKAINSGNFLANMVELKHDGKPQKVLTKDVQFHPVTDMPDNIEVDISGLEIGDAIHLSEVTLPANVTPGITDRVVTIATIVASRTSKTESEDGEEGAEGEEQTAED